MITIITGPIHSGKTTRLVDEFSRCSNGDGFASMKIMDGSFVEGFDLLRLSTGFAMPLARKKIDLKREWNQCCSYGPYSFSKDAVDYVTETASRLMNETDVTFFLDEIGSLELADLCFNDAVLKMLESGNDIFITVRDTNLRDVINKYGLSGARILETGERFA